MRQRRTGPCSSRARARAAGICASVLVAQGCTLLSDFDVHQCEDSGACVSEAMAIGHCEQGRCVAGCATNGECIARDPRFPICRRPSGECAALISAGPECPASSNYDAASMDAANSDDLILIGVFAPSIRSSIGLSLELAIDELNASGGLPGPRGPRPLLAVQCDASLAPAAMHHLVDQLGVVAISGSLDSAVLRTIVAQQDAAEPAFFSSPDGSNFRPGELSRGGDYLWYQGAEERDVALAYSALVSAIAARLPAGSEPGSVTIASIASDRDEDVSLQGAVYAGLGLADGDGRPLPGAADFLSFELPDDSDAGRQAVLELLVREEPDIVLSFAGGVFGQPARQERSSLFRSLEQLAAPAAYAPFYILGPSNVEDTAPARLALESAGFRSRALAPRATRTEDPAARDALDARFEAAYPRAAMLGLQVSPRLYDALYQLAYALAAAPADTTPRAAAVREGMDRVTEPGAPPVPVGPDGVPLAIEYLGAGARFNLLGIDGPADFDPSQQARPGPAQVYCWDERGRSRPVATHDPVAGFISAAPVCGAEIADVLGTASTP